MKKLGFVGIATFILGVGSSEAIKFAAGKQQGEAVAREIGCNVAGLCMVGYDLVVDGKKIGEKIYSMDVRSGTLRDEKQKLSGTPPAALIKVLDDLKGGAFDSLLGLGP